MGNLILKNTVRNQLFFHINKAYRTRNDQLHRLKSKIYTLNIKLFFGFNLPHLLVRLIENLISNNFTQKKVILVSLIESPFLICNRSIFRLYFYKLFHNRFCSIWTDRHNFDFNF